MFRHERVKGSQMGSLPDFMVIPRSDGFRAFYCVSFWPVFLSNKLSNRRFPKVATVCRGIILKAGPVHESGTLVSLFPFFGAWEREPVLTFSGDKFD